MDSTSQDESSGLGDAPLSSEGGPKHWAEEIGGSLTCLNCGVVRQGVYCPDCGQKHCVQRLQFGQLLRELVARLANFEQGLLHTVVLLFKRPGRVSRDYIQGKRRCYVNPLTYFFLGAALQLVSFWLSEDVLRRQLQAAFAQSAAANQMPAGPTEPMQQLEARLGQDVVSALVDNYLATMQQAYAYAALLFFCLPFAVLLRWLHRSTGEPFQLGETLVFALFTFGQVLIITAICTPLTARLGTGYHSAMALATYLILPQHAHTDFFCRTWGARGLTLLATLLSMATFLASILVIFLLSFIGQVVVAQMSGG